MKTRNAVPLAKTAVLAIAEIQSAVQAFDRGEANVFDALDTIIVAMEAYGAIVRQERNKKQVRRDAA